MKKLLKAALVVIIVSIMTISVFANPVLDNPYDENEVEVGIKEEAGYIWATVISVIQILAVACVVYAGLRYMFASADQKADIKQGLTYLAVGAIIIFGATILVNIIATAGNNALK